MTDTIFRGNEQAEVSNVSQEVEKPSNNPVTEKTTDVEPAFTLYESAKNRSYIADYLELGADFNQEAYAKEIKEIEDYFKGKVENGTMENSTEAVRGLLEKAEKELKLDQSERMVVKIQKLLAYLKFKKTVEEVEQNNLRYGGSE